MAQPVSGGAASCQVTYEHAGGHQLTATYSGAANYTGSTSATVMLTVGKALTTTSLAAVPASPVVGQPVVLTTTVAPVAPGAGSPTGTVAFEDNGNPIAGCEARPVGGDDASCQVTYEHAGGHQLSATYSGSPDFVGSTSAALGVTVGAAPTRLVAARPSYTALGVTVGARLTNSVTGTPLAGQTLRFTTRNMEICTARTDANGQARCSSGLVRKLAVIANGGYTASFAATADYLASTGTASA